MKFYITNPDPSLTPEQRRVPLGATVYVQRDEQGLRRIYVDTVQPDTPVFTLQLRPEDELLMLNNESLVNIDIEQLKAILDIVFINQPLTLITRRKKSSKQNQYEYWKITTTIVLEIAGGHTVPKATNVSRLHLEIGDISVREPADVQARYVRTDAGYLKYQDGQIGMNSELISDDSSFKFYLITYDGIVVENGGLVQSRVRLLRHTSGSVNYFLYMTPKSGTIKLEVAPADIGPVPSAKTINDAKEDGTFEIKSALYLSHNAGGGEIFYLECGNKLGCYLKAEPTKPYLVIFRPGTQPLSHINGDRFEMLAA